VNPGTCVQPPIRFFATIKMISSTTPLIIIISSIDMRISLVALRAVS
jgi:hypothetical protein